MKIKGQKIQIFACFSGTGKTFYAKHNNDYIDVDKEKYMCKYSDITKETSDLDIELLKDKVKRKSKDYPTNFINKIIEYYEQGKFLLVVPEPLIMEIIHKNNWPYVLIYPEKLCKEEYRDRIEKRGNSKEFLMWHDMFFDQYIDKCEGDDHAILKIKLKSGEFLTDAMEKIKIEYACND